VYTVLLDEGFLGDKERAVCMQSAVKKYGFEQREISQAPSAVAHSSSGTNLLAI
jgi:hypothetical protein